MNKEITFHHDDPEEGISWDEASARVNELQRRNLISEESRAAAIEWCEHNKQRNILPPSFVALFARGCVIVHHYSRMFMGGYEMPVFPSEAWFKGDGSWELT